ncbi:hypothetical protein F4677DRAFT_434237 [Hypoxylon crocopeplum]|nr:hypothetical protein F4677DRAFT_434237 [Hypoxylon crocopeplum]
MFSISSSFAAIGTKTGGTTTTLRILLALAPVALPTAYLFYLKRSLAKHTVASARISPPDTLPKPPSPESSFASSSAHDNAQAAISDGVLPPDVLAAPAQFVIAHERVVSHPVPIAALRPELATADGLDGLLGAYLSATMRAFAWTPQALLMARMGRALPDPEAYRRTFEAGYLSSCGFRAGDRVCGVYIVRARREGRVVLGLAPPEGWTGPVVMGALDVGFDRVGGKGGGEVVFVNETVLWRREGGRPTMLEGRVGRWLHTLLASWLVVKGVEAVMDGKKTS